MQLKRELARMMRITLAGFVIIALTAAYWAVVERDRLLARQDNPRLVQARAAVQRGAVYDRNNTLLVETTMVGASNVRRYLEPSFYSALGYFSLRYGTGGIENEYDPILSGTDRPRSLEQLILGAPTIGSDIQLTFDSVLQQMLADAFEGHNGAAVLVSVPSGEILALLSSPTYDPNTLDQDWAALLQDSGNPFFNRAIQGRYQPGGAVQTPLLALFALGGSSLNSPIEDATEPVYTDTLTLNCTIRPPRSTLTLIEAYTYGCPAPFLDGAASFQPAQIARALQQLNRTSTSQGDLSLSRDELLGQGRQTISPLDMALLTAAIINGGNSPVPYTLLATRAPEAMDWTAAAHDEPSLPAMTAPAASQLLEAMSTVEATLSDVSQRDVTLGSHRALAFTGEGMLAWYTGFALLPDGQGMAIAVVVEDASDTQRAAEIGSQTLATGIREHERSAARP
jgi:peptidoglycan glycosyltransferase